MKNKELIHIKFDYEEALESKKTVLLSEKELIEIIKILRNYKKLREEENKLKIKLKEKIEEIINDVKKIQKILPDIGIKNQNQSNAQIIGKLEDQIQKVEQNQHDQDLEEQLRNIQEKLRALGN